MDKIVSKVENAWCSVDHGDEYVKANVFCCSCEVYYCNKCDAEKHKFTDNQSPDNIVNDQEMHIRIPVDQVIGDEDDEHHHDSHDKKQLHNEDQKKNQLKNSDIIKELEKEKKEQLKREKELEKEKEKKEKEKKDKEKKEKKDSSAPSSPSLSKLRSKLANESSDKIKTEGTIFEEDIETDLPTPPPSTNTTATATESTTTTTTPPQSPDETLHENEMIFNNVKGFTSNSCALEDGEVEQEETVENAEDQVEASHIGQGVFEGLIELGSGIGDGVTGIISDPMAGAKEGGVKGFFKGVGRGLSGVALKPVKGTSGFFIKTAEGLRNTPETIFTPKNQQIDVVKEKEATHLLDGLYQGTLGLGRGIFEGVTGIIAEPVKGAQEQGGKGFAIGLGKGLLGVVCKPISGAMEFVSKPIEGLANTPKTIIDAIEKKIDEKQQAKLQKQQTEAALKNNENSDEVLYAEESDNDTTSTLKSSGPISSTVKASPVLNRFNKTKEEELKNQQEYNQKWLEKNQVLSNNSISSVQFKNYQ